MENSNPKPTSLLPRRHFLWNSGSGLGAIALACLLREETRGSDTRSRFGARPSHFPGPAKRILHIYAAGGASHVDTFDYKPELTRLDGKTMAGKRKVDTFFGQPGTLMQSPFEFRRRGQSGLWVSDLLPHLAECADDLCMIRSMVAKSSNHTPATFQMNSGFTRNGYPCMGSWVTYGLGSENRDLPGFIVLPDPRGLPAGGSINWTAGFLPASHQGVAFRNSGDPLPYLSTPPTVSSRRRASEMELLARMNREHLEINPGDSALEARLQSYELAAHMQMTIPDIVDLDTERPETRRLYGLDEEKTNSFGRNCLLARRLLEKGVRVVQVWIGGAFGRPRINWDGHEDIKENHTDQADTMDRPLAGLLKDMKERGMLEDTLVVWSTEFGRTPFTEGLGAKGRDHHQLAFTCWLAGAGVRKGFSYGASDDVGYDVARDPVTIYDFHATILHLLGLDHKKLTFYHNGIQRRLTDVHGHVVRGVLA
ncbi:MAG: DUF1501 domain-containing protein [Acidobacteriota bacterium]|nr:DUF1501 domain-containing protein [Acidobacteriota bacterium]